MLHKYDEVDVIRSKLLKLNKIYSESGIAENDMRMCFDNCSEENSRLKDPDKDTIVKFKSKKYVFISFCILMVAYSLSSLINNLYGMRCLVPNNYFIWEATRPLSDCGFCQGLTAPLILHNISREQFKKYAYSSKPIIIKGAVLHWKAMAKFNYDLFKDLYKNTEGSYESIDDGCQFLNFKSDVFSLKEVFEMPIERAKNFPGQKPWYVGWGNCHLEILSVMREYYSIPDFLPEDAEYPNAENIFFGYEIGAVMHLDYIPRLMWQGQVKGNKTWSLVPIPECERACKPFEFYVEPGDIVLLDTRIWYHATRIPPGQFSLTVQSEYG